jgi:hypothetical protein
VQPETIRRYIRDGVIPALKLHGREGDEKYWRIEQGDLRRYIESLKTSARDKV